MPTVMCKTCGKPFTRKQSALNKVKHHYCNEECSNIGKKRPKAPFVCQYCGESFVPKTRKSHQAYCSRVCSNAAKVTSVDINCEVCGKSFAARPSRIENGIRFCSMDCLNIARAQGLVITNTKESTLVARTCQTCGKPFKAKRAEVSYGGAKFCSHACYHQSLTLVRGENHPSSKPKVHKHCLQCGRPMTVIPSVADRTKFCSRQCAGTWHVIHSCNPSGLEQIVANMLDDLGITYEQQKGIGPYACDFYIASANLVIEADGDYWHSLPNNKTRDRRKTTFLLNNNYRLLRLPENRILKAPDWCKRQIRKAIEPGPWQSPIW